MITRELTHGYSYVWLSGILTFKKNGKVIDRHEDINTIADITEKVNQFENNLKKTYEN